MFPSNIDYIYSIGGGGKFYIVKKKKAYSSNFTVIALNKFYCVKNFLFSFPGSSSSSTYC